MDVGDDESNVLEEYGVSVRGLHDSLKGLSSALEEAHARCEKARRACEELRVACGREKNQRKSTRSSIPCPERDRLQEQYCASVESYHDALNRGFRSVIVENAEEPDQIERSRNACNYSLKVLEDHEKAHGCRPRAVMGTAKANSA
jgi:hypothetical protein